MNSLFLRKIAQVFVVILPVFCLILGVEINQQRVRSERLFNQLQATQNSTAQLRKETHFLRNAVEGQYQELKKSVVSSSDPISWCVEHIRGEVGISGFDLEPIGMDVPVEMRMDRVARDAAEGTIACLAPYVVHLTFKPCSISRMQYVFEQLESPKEALIVKNLELSPAEEKNCFQAVVTICLPIFQYPEDWRDICSFLQDTPEPEDSKD